jgi:NACHT domain- and WD repeat-containing protein
LRDLCARRAARFQAIDLRWGIREEAALDQQTINVCVGEIQRCQRSTPRPNFLVLLGDRYGWRPPPPEIPAAEFEAIFDQRLIQRHGHQTPKEAYQAAQATAAA